MTSGSTDRRKLAAALQDLWKGGPRTPLEVMKIVDDADALDVTYDGTLKGSSN